jgi:fructose-bisphosphate aldolase class I
VALATLQCLRRTVPPAVPGIVFLSGGQSAVLATRHLNAMQQRGPLPWMLSFSFARALQEPAMHAWAGKAKNVPAAQQVLLHRAWLNSLAREGQYTPEDEQAGTGQGKAA